MDSKSENGLSCGSVASDLEMQEHIPLKTAALQNFKKMAEHFWVWSQLVPYIYISQQHKVHMIWDERTTKCHS